MLCTGVGISAHLKGVHATNQCLHPRLKWGSIIDLENTHVRCQGYARGVRFLLLIQGTEIPYDLLHMVPGSIVCPRGCVLVQMFQYGVRPTKVGLARCSIKIIPDCPVLVTI